MGASAFVVAGRVFAVWNALAQCTDYGPFKSKPFFKEGRGAGEATTFLKLNRAEPNWTSLLLTGLNRFKLGHWTLEGRVGNPRIDQKFI